MPLEKKNEAFSFIRGIETKAGPKSQATGGMDEAKNVLCTRTGDLESRRGFLRGGDTIPSIAGIQDGGSISASTPPGPSKQLIRTDDETVILDGVESFTKGADDVWVKRGALKACEFSSRDIETVPASTSSKASVATVNGYDVSVWVEQPYEIDDSPEKAARVAQDPPNTKDTNFALKPPAMFYKVVSRDTNAVIVPRTKLEDMETELRCGHTWSVDGIEGDGDPDSRRGPVVMNYLPPATTPVHDLDNEASIGNLATLRIMEPVLITPADDNREETQPIMSRSSGTMYPYLNSPNIVSGEGASVAFVGTGLNDLVITGTYTFAELLKIKVVIDYSYPSPPTTFKYSVDDGASFSPSFPISTSPLQLSDPYIAGTLLGISINFGSAVGHDSLDNWSFKASPSSGNYYTSWLYKEADKFNGSAYTRLFINHTKGANSNYYQMKPQLFAYPDLGVMVLVYANGVNPDRADTLRRGRWKLFYRTINLRPGAGDAPGYSSKFVFSDSNAFAPLAANASLPSGNLGLFMSRLVPTWDADYCFDTSDSPSGGLAIVHQTPHSHPYYNPHYDRACFYTSYSVTASDVSVSVTATREVDLSLAGPSVISNPDMRDLSGTFSLGRGFVKSNGPTGTVSYGVVNSFIQTWNTYDNNAAGLLASPSHNPVITSMSLKGINKWDQTNNKLVADVSNHMILTFDSTSTIGTFRPQIMMTKMTTAGGPTNGASWEHSPLFEQMDDPYSVGYTVPLSPYDDIVNADGNVALSPNYKYGVSIVDVAVAQPKDPSDEIYALFQICNPFSGLRFKHEDVGVPSGPDSWILRKELKSAFASPTPSTSPEILFRNVDIVSDGVVDMTNSKKAYFCVSHSGMPTLDSANDNCGRTCVVDWDGITVATWRQAAYAITSDSIMYGVSEQEKFQNNTCLRGLRSRLSISPSVAKGDMEFGLNSFSDIVDMRKYKWMIPTYAKWNASPLSPMQNTVNEGAIYVASGILWKYAGSLFSENEFLTGPNVQYLRKDLSKNGVTEHTEVGGKAVETFTPKGGLQHGFYVYYFNYFWRDANGDDHTSFTTSISPFGDDEKTVGHLKHDNYAPTFIVSGLQMTNHRSIPTRKSKASGGLEMPSSGLPIDASIQVWRTPVNMTENPGLVMSIPMSSNQRTYTIVDDPSLMEGPIPGVSSSLNSPEVAGGNSLHLFIGSEIRVQPESPVSITKHMNHLVISTTANEVWSSLPLVEGLTPSFDPIGSDGSNFNRFSPSRDERITHVASSGNSFFCFTANNVYKYAGSGDAGYEGPVQVGPGMGIRPTGIAHAIQDGIVYQGQKGFYLLNPRGGRPQYFSGPVQSYDDEKPVGVAVSDAMQTIFIGLGGSSKTILLYNWEFKMWTTWNFLGETLSEIAGMSNYVTQGGEDTFSVLDATGAIWKYKTDSVTVVRRFSDEIDVSSQEQVIPEITTGWIQFPSFHRSFRVYRSNVMFRYAPLSDNCVFIIRVYSNFDDSAPTSTHTLAVDKVSNSEPCEVVVKPTQQKARAIKVNISLSGGSPGYDSEMVILSGLAFLIGNRKPEQAYEPLEAEYESTVS